MSYRVPESLTNRVQVGSAVVVPLSGYSRLGIVVEARETEPDRELQEVRRVAGGLSLTVELVGLCLWVSENTALPLPVVLRNALPPGLKIDLYRVLAPAPGWSWRQGVMVERAVLRKSLGKDGLKEAETGGRIALSPSTARRESVEWVVPSGPDKLDEAEQDLTRAPRQRELLDKIRSRGTCRVRSLLEETGVRREILRGLVDRGAVRLERRSGASPVFAARGSGEAQGSGMLEDLAPSGYLWRVYGGGQTRSAADLCRASATRWEQTLVLAPEVRDVERLVAELAELLPAGTTVAPYHSGLGRERATVYEAARQGAVDVLVGTRTAALVPLSRPGAICIVDEPNSAHRARPGFEGIPLHVRELALERGRREESPVLMLSPVPSLSLYSAARMGEVHELPAPEPTGSSAWPEARIVDMRGSGASIGNDLLEACSEGDVGVVVNRLGYATSVSCSRCGVPVVCETCGIPLVLHGAGSSGPPVSLSSDSHGELACHNCAGRRPAPKSCAVCGSERLTPTGLAVESAHEILSERLGEKVGLATAGRMALRNARVVVGTAHEILAGRWDTVLVPDADSLLFGGGVFAEERGFRVLYSAAESARSRVVVQTRDPENPILDAALRGDYPAFAVRELPRRKRAEYPPYRHLAALTLRGQGPAVRRAIESVIGSRQPRVEALDPIPLMSGDNKDVWRVVLRSVRRRDLAEAVSAAAEIPSAGSRRRPARSTGEVSRIEIELDPEEV